MCDRPILNQIGPSPQKKKGKIYNLTIWIYKPLKSKIYSFNGCRFFLTSAVIFVCIFPSMVTFWVSKLCWSFSASFFGSCESFSTNLWDEPRTLHGMFCACLPVFNLSTYNKKQPRPTHGKYDCNTVIHESYGNDSTVKWPPYLYWWCSVCHFMCLGIRSCFSLAGVHGCKTWDFWHIELDDQPPRNDARKAYPLPLPGKKRFM